IRRPPSSPLFPYTTLFRSLDRLVRRDFVRRARIAARLEVGRRGHDDAPHLADMARDQGGIGELADPDGEIDALLHQIDHPVEERSEEHTSELQSRSDLVCR